MNIYVNGTVLRDHLESSIRDSLLKIYLRIEEGARTSGHKVQLPFPDEKLDRLSPESFGKEIIDRIMRADSIISVYYPPNEAVAWEAHFAAEAGKPQILVVDPADSPKLPVALQELERYSVYELPVEKILRQLERTVPRKGEEPPPPMHAY
jgi:hypothetical protein